MKIIKKIILISTILLALFLPFHGAITVFLPDFFRFWKELILIILVLTTIILEIHNLIQKKSPRITAPELFSLLFIVWTGILAAFFSKNIFYASIATRYLILGFLVFLIFSRTCHLLGQNFQKKLLQKFTKFFLSSLLFSFAFGLCAQFFYPEFFSQFYSTTISSWVPGQTIPIFHALGNFIRMQGASSGPIEFSHLLLLGIFLLIVQAKPKLKTRFKTFWWYFTFLTLVTGILLSYSRAAALGLAIILLIIWSQKKLKHLPQKIIIIFSTLVLIGLSSFLFFPQIQNQILNRKSTSDHFTRPIAAFNLGSQNPIFGNLAKLGPAARIKNLEKNNNDKALIAENIFVDYFAQTGIPGLLFVLAFFITLFRKTDKKFYPFFFAFLLVANLATIFEMTPIAISYFTIFALSKKL